MASARRRKQRQSALLHIYEKLESFELRLKTVERSSQIDTAQRDEPSTTIDSSFSDDVEEESISAITSEASVAKFYIGDEDQREFGSKSCQTDISLSSADSFVPIHDPVDLLHIVECQACRSLLDSIAECNAAVASVLNDITERALAISSNLVTFILTPLARLG